MKERTAALVAAAIGLVAVGGLRLSSNGKSPYAPRIVAQKVVAPTHIRPGPGKIDLSETPSLRIDLEPSKTLRSLGESGESWDYRVVDANGRTYLRRANADENTRTLLVPLAYGRPVVGPRLEVRTQGGDVGSVPLAAMPPPAVEPLATAPKGGLRAFHAAPRGRVSFNRPGLPWGYVRFETARPLARDESWRIEVLQTPLQKRVGASAGLGDGAEAALLYADDVTAVRVRAVRERRFRRSERVVLRGLRLVGRGGQTVLTWADARVPNRLGLDVRLVERRPPFDRLDQRGGDQLAPCADLRIAPLGGSSGGSGFRSEVVGLADPRFAARGLRSLAIGPARWSLTRGRPGPVSPSPFAVALRISVGWVEARESFEATIPVETVPSGENERL